MLQSNMNISLETLLQSLQSTRSALLSEIEMLNDTEVNVKPRRDKWSIIQIMHHLHLVEQSVTSALVYALQKKERKAVQLKDLQLTLDRTHKREAPQQMQPTETLMKKQQGIQLLEHSRQELLHTLHSIIDERELLDNSLKHPIFHELNLYQWIQFLDLHEQRHLTQLKEAKYAILQR
ncbi:DinB family protein [Bacillus gaemokensis]|uniref:Putrescine importer n=1 Tax=Bacillus gaemokensis TaxID=574375 RepID=A0A073KML5_9BACI|nr:DinB family protein [Bacillus gaemokensis]KEK23608.1 Putrescine importer [Bacillus gaemokensis]KYG26403.1 Putrescine importer [Bacillus gaemokensis]